MYVHNIISIVEVKQTIFFYGIVWTSYFVLNGRLSHEAKLKKKYHEKSSDALFRTFGKISGSRRK